ncbi:MBL fold metallo-hydrolase [Arthrospira platensis]|jgi:L-ascorbate metabolism protein UlaG (beta-lactamase superfamily)|uniref:MBL fold metallo-hydrolase n=1 Tax=Limnospira platensis NIES-46 TaxID=1236695 RepID=A0A5M3TDY5_LIMPL|nr:MBL fold metallo-hydrolase [Arthrospira platensis]AMW30673.1 Zn-dependent hydrolase [Arthrospira platensis YZ]KDR55300.1 hypothetical protein APPUASWS_023285 [Arthrospira platensis str. Paraca]MBD2669984.1 MBL fold metallo-hydrolase [Arthrospira platensis FACHB-439]MBD2710459.1 MBL fold metallo-hydrolase [Arthrospira platensis FACHB-835]MDF2207334.1 MBL fold metallo-hydrolase [Arthrospira platensis NCB002]MDT9183087.1 MBL fold metallo-hydrolase [Limnospira sp. PMC 289.06]MDT9295433.1 MBL 
MYLTWLDSNSWLVEMAGKSILIDPWLVGSLVFGNLPWLFKGEKQKTRPLPDRIDAILLSQGLEDHAHIPTLKILDKNIPVVASPNAAKVVRELGYTQIHSLHHRETFKLGSSLEIRAVPGSPIGPTLVENGYVISDTTTHHSLYYEPHGYHSPTLKELAPIDVVITPIMDLALPLIGPIIRGTKSALELTKMVQPQVILPTAAAGDVSYEGLLVAALKVVGNLEDFRSLIARHNLKTRVLNPQPGERFAIDL